ncbi:MAG: DUF2642 domain-containing protein [Firmicutes bacterium]|nr:DUF2642 domain-containing protein [Bacillota bacterium]
MSAEDPSLVTGFDEPQFVRHLQSLVGQQVQVATVCGTIAGVLRQVFPDHILLETPQGPAHVRMRQMCWVRPMAAGMMM